VKAFVWEFTSRLLLATLETASFGICSASRRLFDGRLGLGVELIMTIRMLLLLMLL